MPPFWSTPRRWTDRFPIRNVSSPSLGFDDSGNFYILSEYTGAVSGALALQKYKFTGSTPTTVNFTTNDKPQSLQFRAVKPEDHLPVGQLGH